MEWQGRESIAGPPRLATPPTNEEGPEKEPDSRSI